MSTSDPITQASALPSRRDFLRGTLGTAAGLTLGSSVLSTMLATPASAGDQALRVRRNIKDLSAQDKADFVGAILEMKHHPSPWNPNLSTYDHFVWWHKKAFNCDIAAAHMQPSFPPWHRAFLLLFEFQLELAAGKPIPIPYWDWTDPESTSAAFADDMLGGNGNPDQEWALTTGPFRKGEWRINVFDPPRTGVPTRRWIVRNQGAGGYELPTAEQVDKMMTIPDYDVAPFDPGAVPGRSMRNYLEGWRGCKGMTCDQGLMQPVKRAGTKKKSQMHNGVHLWVGGLWDEGKGQGTMLFNTSNNDPAFYLHHSNIDRVWWQWEQIQGQLYEPVSGLPPGQNLNDTMWPFNTVGIDTTIAGYLDVEALGYTYG